MNSVPQSSAKFRHLPVFSIAALVISLFLFFIDEGAYSLSGLSDMGNLVPMGFYFIAMFLGQVLVFVSLPHKLSDSRALRLSLFFGNLLGAIAMAAVLGWWMN